MGIKPDLGIPSPKREQGWEPVTNGDRKDAALAEGAAQGVWGDHVAQKSQVQ